MSLAYSAALVDENSNTNNDYDNNYLIKKRQTITHNKTQKNFDTGKVNSVLEALHKNQRTDDDENKSNLGSFNPPPKPVSPSVNKTIATEQMMNMTNQNDIMFRTLGRAPQPNNQSNDELDLNDYSNYGDNKTNEEYYKRVIPGYDYSKEKQQEQEKQDKNTVNRPYYNQGASYKLNNVSLEDSILLQKMNYMITLLEDQQDEKTNNVTEEVILYSFLGIFIIFIADSFVKVGKYVR
jgi:hypothetical protein